MNELEFFSTADDGAVQGFRKIIVTEPAHHAYMKGWWPAGHIIGYEHTFTHTVYDLLEAMAGQEEDGEARLRGRRPEPAGPRRDREGGRQPALGQGRAPVAPRRAPRRATRNPRPASAAMRIPRDPSDRSPSE